jgi:hypothetical protein
MLASNFPILSVDTLLDESPTFYQLQALSDENEDADLLATKSTDEVQKRWLKITNSAEDLAKSHTDGRIELLRYRADLRLRGIYAALGRLASAGAELKQILESSESTEQMVDDSVPCEVAFYFFGDAHLREFASASLHESVVYSPSAMLQTLQKKPVAIKNIVKPDPELQKMLEVLGDWGRNHREILHRIKVARSFLHDLERWLSKHNLLGIEINSGPIQRWLSRLEEFLLPCIVPPSAVNEAVNHHRSLGAAINETGAAPTEVHQQSAASFLPLQVASNANSGLVGGLTIQHLAREDVLNTLKTLCQWYELHEPGSPAPYFLQRAIRSMNTDFISILQDLLPESVGTFEKMVGMKAHK